MNVQPRCPVCGAVTHVYRLVGLETCIACNLTFASDRRTTVAYDQRYVAERYDRYPTTEAMSQLRLRVLEHVLYLDEAVPQGYRFGMRKGPLVDVGFGNGSFIRHARANRWDAYGLDVNPTEYEGVRRVTLAEALAAPRWRVVSFFDSLEHFEELAEVRQLVENADWLVVSAPLPPRGFPTSGEPWKHYRPGEHHWYFEEPRTLERVFTTRRAQARVVYAGYPEDAIRGRAPSGAPNIQTAILRVEAR